MGQSWDKMRKKSEELLRQKPARDRENRPVLTGFRPLKGEEPSLRESLRLENSRGTLAFGGDERKRMTLLVTEKRRPGGTAGTDRERVLREKGQRSRPMGENRTLTNPGERENGAFGFQMRPSLTRTQMLEQMKRYMGEHKQKALKEMLPFLVTREDVAYKQGLEQALREARREKGGSGARELEGLLEEEKQELVWKRQAEARFSQSLEKALREEKQTVWADHENTGMRLLRTALEAALGEGEDPENSQGGADEAEDAGETPDSGTPEEKFFQSPEV